MDTERDPLKNRCRRTITLSAINFGRVGSADLARRRAPLRAMILKVRAIEFRSPFSETNASGFRFGAESGRYRVVRVVP